MSVDRVNEGSTPFVGSEPGSAPEGHVTGPGCCPGLVSQHPIHPDWDRSLVRFDFICPTCSA